MEVRDKSEEPGSGSRWPDGVSEGEYARVNDEEIRRVEGACSLLNDSVRPLTYVPLVEYLATGDPFKGMPPQQRPQVVFVVVGKR